MTDDDLHSQLVKLTEGLANADQALDREAKARREEREATEKAQARRDRNRNIVVIVAGVVAAIGLVVAVVALKVGASAQATGDDIRASRAENKVGSCQQDNVRIEQHNDLVDANEATRQASVMIQSEIDAIMAFSTAVPDGVVLSDAAQARLDAILSLVGEQKARVDAALEAAKTSLAGTLVDSRICTQASIDAYLSTTTTAPP